MYGICFNTGERKINADIVHGHYLLEERGNKVKVLVVAPHPDDETVGMGGTILKHIKMGDEVYLAIVTVAYTPDWSEEIISIKREEVTNVCELYGIKKAYLLDFPAVKLDTIPQKTLNDKISEIVEEVRPDVVYTSHKGDINKDHGLVFEATMVATRPKPNACVKKVLCYEVISSTEWTFGKTSDYFIPNYYQSITEYLETKLKILKAYKTETQKYPHPRSLRGVRIHAYKRGLEIGKKAAEAFMLVRSIDE